MKELTWKGIKLSWLEGMVEVLTFGAEKYAEDNWIFVPNLRNRYFSALMRHLIAWAKGDVIDEESGLNHLHHCLCNAYFLMYEAKFGVPKEELKGSTSTRINKDRQNETLSKVERNPHYGLTSEELHNELKSAVEGVKFDGAKPKWHLINLSLIREAVELKKETVDNIEQHYEDLIQLCSYFKQDGNDLSWNYALFNKVLQLIIDSENPCEAK